MSFKHIFESEISQLALSRCRVPESKSCLHMKMVGIVLYCCATNFTTVATLIRHQDSAQTSPVFLCCDLYCRGAVGRGKHLDAAFCANDDGLFWGLRLLIREAEQLL